LKKKIDEKVLLVHPVTSLDDAIDINLCVFDLISHPQGALLTGPAMKLSHLSMHLPRLLQPSTSPNSSTLKSHG
jgi:hypothetical protein